MLIELASLAIVRQYLLLLEKAQLSSTSTPVYLFFVASAKFDGKRFILFNLSWLMSTVAFVIRVFVTEK